MRNVELCRSSVILVGVPVRSMKGFDHQVAIIGVVFSPKAQQKQVEVGVVDIKTVIAALFETDPFAVVF